MKLLIFGASHSDSIGRSLGQALAIEHTIVYASRSGVYGRVCNIAEPDDVAKILEEVHPEVIIHCAGIFPQKLEALGAISDWAVVRGNIAAKVLGSIVLLDAAIKFGGVQKILFMGGAQLSNEPGFSFFVPCNAGMAGAVLIAPVHLGSLQVFYLEIPVVVDSYMLKQYRLLRPGSQAATEVTVTCIQQKVTAILSGVYPNGSSVIV